MQSSAAKCFALYKLVFCFSVQNYCSILRLPNRKRKSSGRRARLSPLVLVLDGALAGDLETVQKAVQEVCILALSRYC